MGPIKFWIQATNLAFRHSLSYAQDAIFVAILLIGVASYFAPKFLGAEAFLSAWQAAALVLGAIVLVRLLLAPYWLWKEAGGDVDGKYKSLEDAGGWLYTRASAALRIELASCVGDQSPALFKTPQEHGACLIRDAANDGACQLYGRREKQLPLEAINSGDLDVPAIEAVFGDKRPPFIDGHVERASLHQILKWLESDLKERQREWVSLKEVVEKFGKPHGLQERSSIRKRIAEYHLSATEAERELQQLRSLFRGVDWPPKDVQADVEWRGKMTEAALAGDNAKRDLEENLKVLQFGILTQLREGTLIARGFQHGAEQQGYVKLPKEQWQVLSPNFRDGKVYRTHDNSVAYTGVLVARGDDEKAS